MNDKPNYVSMSMHNETLRELISLRARLAGVEAEAFSQTSRVTGAVVAIENLKKMLATAERERDEAISQRHFFCEENKRHIAERDEPRLFLGDALNERDKLETTIIGLRDDAKIAQGWIDHHAGRAKKADADLAHWRTVADGLAAFAREVERTSFGPNGDDAKAVLSTYEAAKEISQ